ncbi:hypothetical protein [Clostridium butyricum]
MGFFSGLCSFVSSAASAVGGAVKSVVGGVAKGIGKAVKEIVANSPDIFKGPDIIDIINFFRDLFGNSSSSVGSSSSYDSENASLDETEVVNRILAEFSLNMQEKADEFEKEAINDARAYFDQFLVRLEEIQNADVNELKLELPLNKVRKEMNDLEKKIQGSIKKYVSSKISQDNQEVMNILKMKAGDEKTNKIKKLAEKVLSEALDIFAEKVKKTVEAQGKTISSLLEGNLNQITTTMKAQSEAYEELEKAKAVGEQELKNKRKEIDYVISLCNVAISEVN